MDLYELERADAIARIGAQGHDAGDYGFAMELLPPDPDGAGMFTVEYWITITNNRTGKSLGVIGGIGSRWVDQFEEELKAGYFD